MLNHLVCIMDGNRRWALKNKRPLPQAYAEGINAIKRVIQFSKDYGITHLTLYAFSLENVQRSTIEKHLLFSLLDHQEKWFVNYCLEHNVRIYSAGKTTQVPSSVRLLFNRVESATHNCSGLHLQILFYYGGRQEVIHAINSIVKDVKVGSLRVPLTEKELKQYLWTHGFPDPDLIIRTGGHKRLSNCLLYQSAYSELYFLDTLWPDMSTSNLEDALQSFMESKRNYGK